jgi:hypothetical protein
MAEQQCCGNCQHMATKDFQWPNGAIVKNMLVCVRMPVVARQVTYISPHATNDCPCFEPKSQEGE